MMSSEDIKCFYCLFKIPRSWWPFMGFAGRVPQHLVPRCWAGEPCHLVAQVLPMGFINSVGLAQRIHRNVVHWRMARGGCDAAGEIELRRDRPAPRGPGMFRVYLDNWDEVRKVDKQLAHDIEGHPSAHQLALRHHATPVRAGQAPEKSGGIRSTGQGPGSPPRWGGGGSLRQARQGLEIFGIGLGTGLSGGGNSAGTTSSCRRLSLDLHVS